MLSGLCPVMSDRVRESVRLCPVRVSDRVRNRVRNHVRNVRACPETCPDCPIMAQAPASTLRTRCTPTVGGGVPPDPTDPPDGWGAPPAHKSQRSIRQRARSGIRAGRRRGEGGSGRHTRSREGARGRGGGRSGRAGRGSPRIAAYDDMLADEEGFLDPLVSRKEEQRAASCKNCAEKFLQTQGAGWGPWALGGNGRAVGGRYNAGSKNLPPCTHRRSLPRLPTMHAKRSLGGGGSASTGRPRREDDRTAAPAARRSPRGRTG